MLSILISVQLLREVDQLSWLRSVVKDGNSFLILQYFIVGSYEIRCHI